MQLYGYELPTTPNLNTYLQRTVVFENAYCTSTNTDPSLTALITGKYPLVTGVHHHGSKVTRSEILRAERLQYSTEILRHDGFWTGAVDVSDRWHRKGYCEYFYQTKSNFYGLGSIGNNLLDNLHAYDIFFAVLTRIVSPTRLPSSNLKAENITDSAIRLIREKWRLARGSGGNFLFLHYWDTHTPYSPPDNLLKEFLVPRDLAILDSVLHRTLSGRSSVSCSSQLTVLGCGSCPAWNMRLLHMTTQLQTSIGRLEDYSGKSKTWGISTRPQS